MNGMTITANSDNDKKFWTGMEDQREKKRKEEEKKFQESGNEGEEKIEYFTE